MASLQVPVRHRKTLQFIANLSQDAFAEIVNALAKTPPCVFGDAFVSRVADGLTHISVGEAKDILRMLIGLYLGMASQNVVPESLASDVAEALTDVPDRETTGGREAFSASLIEILRTRLGDLLRIPSLDISAKALGVRTEHQRVFSLARIFTDIRPVFPDDVSSGPTAVVVVHTLKLEYHCNGDLESFFVALDSTDLDALIKVLERAKNKETSLQGVLSTANLPRLIEK